MSWLRLDDGFAEHPKFDGWTVAQRWAWLEVLLYCARRDTDGHIPDVKLMPRNVTAALLDRAVRSGLADVDRDGNVHVHDWTIYNPTRREDGIDEDKVQAFIVAYPDASANDIIHALGGNRNRMLALIRRFRPAQQNRYSEPGGTGNTRGHARAARTPTPLNPSKPKPEPEPKDHGTGSGSGTEEIERLDPRAELERLTTEGAA